MSAGQTLGPHQEPGWCRNRWQGRRQARSGEAGVQHWDSPHWVDTDLGRPQRFPQWCVGASINELPHELNTSRQSHGRSAWLTCTRPFRGSPWARSMPTSTLDMNYWHVLRKSPRRDGMSQPSSVQNCIGGSVLPPETPNFACMAKRLDALRRYAQAG
jgi:hypothetical protein